MLGIVFILPLPDLLAQLPDRGSYCDHYYFLAPSFLSPLSCPLPSFVLAGYLDHPRSLDTTVFGSDDLHRVEPDSDAAGMTMLVCVSMALTLSLLWSQVDANLGTRVWPPAGPKNFDRSG